MTDETVERRVCEVCSREYLDWGDPHRCHLSLRLRVFAGDSGVAFEIGREIAGTPEGELRAIMASVDQYVRGTRTGAPVTPELAAFRWLAGGAHESARDNRIRDAWRDRGLVSKVVPRLDGARDAIVVSARLRGRVVWDLRRAYDSDALESVRNELASRASSMRPEEQIAYYGLIGHGE